MVENSGGRGGFSAIKMGGVNSLGRGCGVDRSQGDAGIATKYALIKEQLGSMLDPRDYLRKMPSVPREHYLSIPKRPIPFKGKVPGEVDQVNFRHFFKEKWSKNYSSTDNLRLIPADGTYGNLKLPTKNPRPISDLPSRLFSGACRGVALGEKSQKMFKLIKSKPKYSNPPP